MKSVTRSYDLGFAQSRELNLIPRLRTTNIKIRLAVLLVPLALLLVTSYWTSSASLLEIKNQHSPGLMPEKASDAGLLLKPIETLSPSSTEPLNRFVMSAPQAVPSIGIFDSDCTTPKSVFNVGDTVCAVVSGVAFGGAFPRRLTWEAPDLRIAQTSDVVSDPQNSTLNITATFAVGAATVDSRGRWRVVVRHPFFFFLEASAGFTVLDPANATADLGVTHSFISESVQAGGQATFGLHVINYGPDTSANITVANAVPANTTFVSFQQLSGPTFTCNSPSAGSTGTTVCTLTGLAANATATFVGVYEVDTGVAAGTRISNQASIDSGTNDLNQRNTSTEASTVVVAGAGGNCTLTCPVNVVVTADTTSGGQPGKFVTFAAAAVDGDCGSVTNSPASGSFFTVGTHSITSTSAIGGASCFFTVTVLDSNPPTITCPANVLVTAPTGATEMTVSVGTPTINASGGGTVTFVRSDDVPAVRDDNGEIVTPAIIHALTDPFPIGTTGIQWTVTDAGNRTATCSQSVTVVGAEDRDPVTISCPAHVTVNAPSGNCSATVPSATIGTPTTVPSDSNIEVEAVRSDGRPLSDPFPAGTTQITWRATDNLNGSHATCVQNVTVTVGSGADTTPPTLVVPANVVATTSSCTAILDDELGTAEAEDTGACSGAVTVSRSGVPAGFAFLTGVTTITYTATDAAGNTTTLTQTVTVTESPAVLPTVTAPADVTVNTGPGATSCGTVVSDALLGTAVANDNCPGVIVTRTGVPAGNVFPVGNTTVTYTATDRSGNIATDTQVVTVNDNTPPVVTPPANITVFLPLNSTATSMVVNYPNPATATDNCPGTLNITYSPASGSTFPVGSTTVTASTTDAHGNPGSATFTVTVLYNFTGFFAPVDNLPTLNVVAAGKAVPVKFSLSGNKGLNIFAANSPSTVSINCDGSLPQDDIEETLNAGGSSLSYDAASDTYIYVWKTQNNWKNTCRQLVVVLNDGSEHRANFKFK